MFQADGPGLPAAERQAGHGAVLRVGEGPVAAVHHRDGLFQEDLREIARLPVVHHDEHRLALALGEEVVQDDVRLALEGPAGLVLAAAVLQVQHRIALAGIAGILGRDIHPGGAPGLQGRGPVALQAHVAPRHVLVQVEIDARLGNVDGAGVRSGAEIVLAGRIARAETVHDEEIVVETRLQRVRRDPPGAFALADHRIHLAADVHAHLPGLRGRHLEADAEVVVDFRGAPPGRLGGQRRGAQQQRENKK